MDDHPPSTSNLLCQDPKFWQASARRALLHKFGYLASDDTDSGKWTTRNVESTEEIESIQRIWEQVVENVNNSTTTTDDLGDFVHNHCQSSNRRALQWSGMTCPPGSQFRLHAHPNLELVYCSRGALHEVRMLGEPLTKQFERDYDANSTDNEGAQLKGPNLTDLQRPWKFATLPAGRWLVNEVGSIHKSFTSTAGTGCQLLVLWGGSHANIENPPATVNVQDAVDATDQKLHKSSSSTSCNKGDCTNWSTMISETFLPDSEKSRSKQYR